MLTAMLSRWISKLFLRLVDLDVIADEWISLKLRRNSELVQRGEGTNFYEESTVFNYQNNPQKIRIGKNSHIRGELLLFNYGGEIIIGNNVFIGAGSKIWSGEQITIGDSVLISHNVNISDTTAHEPDYLERATGFRDLINKGHPNEKGSIQTIPIHIGDYAWINFNSIILKGVTIGKGAIVAAGSVVTRDVPDFVLVAGNPAAVVKQLKSDDLGRNH